jgi:hypothetical protein
VNGVLQRSMVLLMGAALACATPPPGAAFPAASGAAPAAGSTLATGADDGEATPFALPARRSEPVRAAEPLALPLALRSPIDVTLELETTLPRAGGDVIRHEDVARSAAHIHARLVQERAEWLFVRNPLDERRVSATLVDHRQRAIIEYPESELRMSGIARGWADVAYLGIGIEALERLQPTGRTLNRFGFDFVELGARGQGPGAASEVWWSEALALPLTVSRGSQAPSVVVRTLRRGVDSERFTQPRARFSGYALMDAADYREKHHEPTRALPQP